MPRRLLVAAAAGIAALSVALAVLRGSPLAYALGGVTLPGLATAAVAGVLALMVLLRSPGRRPLVSTTVVLVALGCTAIHGCALDRPFVVETMEVASRGATIRGELHLPEGPGPFPAVVIVPGSAGSQPVTRDSQFGLYRAAADRFVASGIAAVVYDRRGSGASSGNRREALLVDHAEDVIAIQRRLAMHEKIRADATGLWGISAGTWVAGLAAAREPVAFLVLVSAPADSEGRQQLYEWSRRLAHDGLDEHDIDELVDLRWRIWTWLATGDGYDRVRSDYEAARREPWWPQLDRVIFPRWLASPAAAAEVPAEDRRWFITDMTRDPLQVLDAVDAPVLAIYGDRDEMIPMPSSRQRMQAYAKRRGARVTVRTYEDANHGLIELAFPPRYPQGYWPGTIDWAKRQLAR